MNIKQKIQLLENLTGKKVILKETAEDRLNRPKIKLRAMWQDREQRRREESLKQEVIDEDLNLSKEPIKNLGNIRYVNGHLDLHDCKNLTSLPADLTVNGDLWLNGCESLTSLPADLKVGGGLCLDGCESLTSLPAGLTVKDWLDLKGCESLTSLPAGLTVKDWLDLTHCESLTSLPADLKVNGKLNLQGCQQQVIDQAIQMFGENKVRLDY